MIQLVAPNQASPLVTIRAICRRLELYRDPAIGGWSASIASA